MSRLSLLLALSCSTALVGGCDDGGDSSQTTAGESEGETEGSGETETPGETDEAECAGEGPEACLEGCGGDIVVGDPVCSDGAWVCEEGVASDECGPSCAGEAPFCTEGCDIDLGPAACLEGAWTCEDGILAEECEGACGDDPPLCAADCEDPSGPGEPVAATCEIGAWTCNDVEPADCEPITCEDDENAACLEACGSDIVLAEPVCGECAEGVHSDSCGELCEGEAWVCLDECGGAELEPAVCGKTGWECAEGVPEASCE